MVIFSFDNKSMDSWPKYLTINPGETQFELVERPLLTDFRVLLISWKVKQEKT